MRAGRITDLPGFIADVVTCVSICDLKYVHVRAYSKTFDGFSHRLLSLFSVARHLPKRRY